jgi:PncC family amidohydrolase
MQRAGSSAFYLGSVIAYANAAKMSLLHVDQKTLAQFGAVSREVAIQMAIGVQKTFQAAYAISTTGVAGPTGGTAEKPVGTVYIALAGPDDISVRQYLFAGDRTSVRQQTVEHAIILLEQAVTKL